MLAVIGKNICASRDIYLVWAFLSEILLIVYLFIYLFNYSFFKNLFVCLFVLLQCISLTFPSGLIRCVLCSILAQGLLFCCYIEEQPMKLLQLFFQMSAIWKFDFQERKQLCFSEVNYLNYTKKTQFCMWQLRFPQNRGKQEQTVYPFHTP